MSDYLWDRSGKPDPEIERLERVLGRLRHQGSAPVFPEAARMERLRTRTLSSRWGLYVYDTGRMPALATAFAVAVMVAGLTFLRGPKAPAVEGWNITSVAGSPRVGGESVGAADRTEKFSAGQVLETDGQSRVRIRVEDIGEIRIDPDSRLRMLTSAAGASRLALDRGTIHARIWAPPGNFVVDTPSALTVDLGCAFTLHVDDSGDGLIRTSLGWVGFKLGDRESFIPAGAACMTRAKGGPGTPYFEDAPEALRTALATLDLAGSPAEERIVALRAVLADSRKHDALTLWHLLARVDRSERGLVFDRLAQFAPPPSGVTREGIVQLDRTMLDRWWNQLDLGDISLWRHWEKSWSQQDRNQK